MKNHWTKKASFYHIYPLGFCGAPRFHVETETNAIREILNWIPHMKEMNINAIYLGPIFESYEHGYDTSDYRLVDKRLGSNADFKDVCDALHDAGIRIVLDGVFNHVGRYFWAFLDVKEKREASPYASWFHKLNFHQHSPLGDDFTYEAWEGHYNLVKLNLRNEEVVQYLLESVGMWMDEFHIDGLRLDAADCIDREFFKRLKQYTQNKNNDFWLMGEIIHGDYTMWANHEMLDSVTNYECYKGLYSAHNTKNYFEIAHSIQRQFGPGGIYKHLNLYSFVDNHDVNRLASVVSNELDLVNIYTLMYCMPGIPSIYYGSEYGIKGTKHDGSDADIRPCLHLADYSNDHPLYAHICKLGEIYKQYSALQFGNYEQVIVRNEQFVFQRSNEQEQVYIALNLSDKEIELSFPSPCHALYDVLHDQSISCDGECKLLMKPHDSCILVNDGPTNLLEKEVEPIGTFTRSQPMKPKNMEPEIVQTTVEETETPVHDGTVLKPGRYRHFKGNDYSLLYVAKHSEDLSEYVVYRQLYGEGSVWIRPASMFKELVNVDGESVPRFTYLGK